MGEKNMGDVDVVSFKDGMSLEVLKGGTYTFDGVFSPGSQEEVFEGCRDLVQSAIDGHNATIFTYGQTGAGKTYTMYGMSDKNCVEKDGIAPRTITELFRIIENLHCSSNVTVIGSMVEVYNNHLIDLLKISRNVRGSRQRPERRLSSKLKVRRSRGGNVKVERLAETVVNDAAQLKSMLQRGLAHRAVAANVYNIESSRSHLIFTIGVTTFNPETNETTRGKIILCDLGGSERLKKTEVTGETKKEAIEINKSLTALGDVIEAVAKKKKQIPYRNHKLTQILQDSLGGTAKTLMFVNCSPAKSCVDETLVSLKYATRVKKITNSVSDSGPQA